MLALALADNAFKNNFRSLRDIYNLVVPPDADRIALEWDDKWVERPIFRDVEATANGVRISKTNPFLYSKYRYYFVRLGRVMGYEKALELYGLRRGSGKELNGMIIIPFVSMLPVSFAFLFANTCCHRCTYP
jgi:hypothetical protein